MRKRPVALILCALLFLYFPAECLVRWTRGSDILVGDLFFSLIFPLCLLFGLITVGRFGWYTLIAFALIWGFKDLYEFYASQSSSLLPLLIHLLIFGVSLAYFITPRIRHLYFDPKLRWWRTKLRYETHLPCLIRHQGEWLYPILRNISEGGCFLETSHLLQADSKIEISIPLPIPLNVSVIKADAEVRWASENPLRHGLGVQFVHLSSTNARAVKLFLKRQL